MAPCLIAPLVITQGCSFSKCAKLADHLVVQFSALGTELRQIVEGAPGGFITEVGIRWHATEEWVNVQTSLQDSAIVNDIPGNSGVCESRNPRSFGCLVINESKDTLALQETSPNQKA